MIKKSTKTAARERQIQILASGSFQQFSEKLPLRFMMERNACDHADSKRYSDFGEHFLMA